ncbi:acyl-Coenzyme A oxidase [Entomortierella chlamydospora]|uniref:Acyl-coenzyme A oxidase n=1 Tax=Entomortierella chlamydospora TaxID=101097 RepID=A0A9P6T295_9FUNG|nr:acyl-Coenzyme A oxidase [Entomortierella chlamydospora]KAG0018633.1 acyl-Coenzyme A oxidase [Entomortierella chlamydospora]
MTKTTSSSASSAKARLQATHGHLSIQPCFHSHAIHNNTPRGPADLARERTNASFKTMDMTEVILRGKENVVAQSLAYQMIQCDPELRMHQGHNYDLTRDEDHEQTLRQVALFGTSEQQDKWMGDIESWRVIGCFAMTELGHSSNLPGLETTSTFDRATNEFVIHSPNLTSTKWWIGMAGRTATHSIVVCRTLIDGKDYGLNWFIVPLRDRRTGRLFPGVVCGDVGQKASRQGLDTGYIQFTHVRIPRENMLQRWASFNPQGEFRPMPNQAISYAPLISERFTTLRFDQVTLSRSLTIAVRYGAVRRQGAHDEQILDYQTHQTMLMPGVAFIYLLNIVEREVCEKWGQVKKFAQTDTERFMRELPDQHGVAASFKAMMSWYVVEVLESCSRSCGGHAYSAYNAIPGLIGDFGVITTGGGDNIVLMQQSARFMISALRKVRAGQEVEGSVDYMNDYGRVSLITKTSFQDPRDLFSHEFVIDALKWASLKKTIELQEVLSKAGTDFDMVWNAHQTELVRMADIHTWLHFLIVYQRGVQREKAGKPEVYAMLKKMGQLMSTFVLKRHLDLFLEEGYFDGWHAKLVRQLFLDQCKDLRKDAVALVDAWAIPDFVLKAPIGKYDGDI